MKLILTRHGQTEWNLLRKTQGVTDINLTELGVKQAERFAKRVREMTRVDAIYTSPLARARDSADIIARECSRNVYGDDRLKEIRFGIWEGLTYPQICENYPQLIAQWNESPLKCFIPEAEPITHVLKRVREFIDMLLGKYGKEETLVVVSHSVPVKLILADALGVSLERIHSIRSDNLSLNIIDYYPEKPVVRVMNDVSHLKGLL